MRFLLLVCATPDFAPDMETMPAETDAWVNEVEARDMRETGARAAMPEDAVTVQVIDGELRRFPGRRVDAEEQVIGFDVMNAADIDEMVEALRTHPMAREGRIEVRPLIDDE